MEIILITAGLLLMLRAWWSHYQLRASYLHSGPRQQLRDYPSVSVIRPIKGLDTEAKQNIAAALRVYYPAPVETLFVLDDEGEPALPLIRQAIAEHQQAVDARVVICGEPPEGRTGKLNAMMAGLAQAQGEIIVFADSDIRPDSLALEGLVEALLQEETIGASFAPVIVSHPPSTMGDVGYSLLLNGLYGPAFMFVAERQGGRLPFIMGQFMAFRRQTLAAIGGLESAEGQLVDDMYLGARVKAAGLENAVAPHPVPVIQEGMSLGSFWQTYVRWIAFSRSGLPGRSFKLIGWMRGLIFWTALILSAVALAWGLWIAAATNALAAFGVASSINRLHNAYGGPPVSLRWRWVSFLLLLIAPLIYLRVLVLPRVTWRGRNYRLNLNAQLEHGRALAPDQFAR